MRTLKSDFLSRGVRCDGDLLLPEGIDKPPVIIMGHGLAAQKNFRLMAYSERFVQKKLAVFLFDYRTFGKSDGSPRQVVDPFRHLEDWRAAIAHVRTLPEVDASRIALWGSSFGGGHVISAASEDDAVTAVVSQVPHVSTFVLMRSKGIQDIFLSGVYGIYDLIRSFLGMSPHYSPVFARPGSFAAMNTEESFDGYMSIVGDDTQWENRLTSRVFIKLMFYNPVLKAKKVKAPVLVMAGSQDSLVPLAAVQKCAARLRKGELIVMDCNHFAPYTGGMFEQFVDKQAAFLEKHLL